MSPRATTFMPPAELAADEYLRLFPDLAKFRPDLTVLAQAGWRGEWPLEFFRKISDLVRYLPWLREQLHRWLDPAVIAAIREQPLPDGTVESFNAWTAQHATVDITTGPWQFEGFLLLSRLTWGVGNNEPAHRMLSAILAKVSYGLAWIKKDGKPARSPRSHPLKQRMYSMRDLQTIEAVGDSLKAFISDTRASYPRFAQFLHDAYLPLILGTPRIWTAPASVTGDDDLLGIDKDPLSPVPTKIGQEPLEDFSDLESGDSPREARAFTKSDVAEEMLVMVSELAPEKGVITALAEAWKGEDTWDFFESIPRLNHWVHWVTPILQKRFDLSALQVVGQTLRSKDRRQAEKKARKWRQQKYLAPKVLDGPSALVTPSNKDRRMGIFHLRGFLLVGRVECDPETIAGPDNALSEVISNLQRRIIRKLSVEEIADGFEQQHPVELVLDRIGNPNTPGELAAEIELLLPEISSLHADLANLLRQAYLPILKREPVVWTPHQKPTPAGDSKKGSRARGKAKRSRKPYVRRTRVGIPGREKPLPGESIEETQGSFELFRSRKPRKKAVPLKKELLWVHQRVWGSNPLLVRNHIESICDAEAALFVQVLDARIAADLSAKEVARARTGILVALTLLTGQGARTWAGTRVVVAETGPATDRSRLLLDKGVLELPILQPENAFKPDEHTASLLEPVSSTIALHLPPKLHSRIKDLVAISMDPWDRDVKALRSSLDAYIAAIEPEVGTGITLPRVRNFARARLREATGDMCATMTLCGDSFGQSAAPLYYASLSVANLEQSFRKAMWPLFGDAVPRGLQQGQSKARVGSKLLVKQSVVREMARGPGAPMHAAGKRRREDHYLVSDHNSLVNHALCMLMGTIGHRPTSALLRLSRFDFDTDLHAAIFRDKQCDPAHLFRYVPLPDLLSEQIDHYVDHLRRLAELTDIPRAASSKAKGALLGESPLFFHLGSERQPVELAIDTWSSTLPKTWGALPLNWGRTWLSSRGREAGIDPDHLAIALGHLDSTGYPFSRESPLEPAQLSREISARLGQLARSAGWVARKGLRTEHPDAASQLEELGPLADWEQERKSIVELSNAFEAKQRQMLWSNLRSKREEGERIARTALESVVARPVEGFEHFRELRARNKDSKKSSDPSEKHVVLSAENLEAVQDKIDEATRTNRALMIAAHNALRRYLKDANKLLGWDSPIPSPWLAPRTLEPTPFFPGLLRATAQVRAIRGHFKKIPARPIDGFTEFEWACGISAMALVAFGFEDCPDRVLEILKGRRSRTRSKTLDDLVLIDVGEVRRPVGVRGLGALAISRLAKHFPEDGTPSIERLCEVLAAQIPSLLANGTKDLLQRLCATVSIANRVELSGLARAALDREDGCVAMPTARQRQFLEEGLGPEGQGAPAGGSKGAVDLQMLNQRCVQSVVRQQYARLRETLHIGEGPKKFEITGEVLTQANIVAFRGPLRRELTAFLAQDHLSPLVACIGAFALDLTTNGTRDRKEPAWSTVHSYVTSFGSELIQLASDMDFLHLEPEEYIDLYQDVLDHKESGLRQAVAARELIDFHRFLQEHHGFEAVDFSDLEGVEGRSDHQVDAEVVQPQEFLRGLAALTAQASVSRQAGGDGPDRTRLYRQAEVFALLLRGSGARHNELAALRFKDVLATIEATVLLIRPSRYRRLKTSSARRVVDCSLRLSGRHRRIVSEWIAAERNRLGKAWKATLPIFSKKEIPKERVASADLRDVILGVLDEPIGCRSKIHRVRHLVAGEDLLAIWLSDTDWKALRHARVCSHRPVRGSRRAAVVLPRHIRAQSLRFGHRHSSTTLTNYFHMPWAVSSRAHGALSFYVDRHSAAVALGVSAAGADKVFQRGKSSAGRCAASVWLTNAAGVIPPTPGRASESRQVQLPAAGSASISARLVDRVLRDIQRGLSPPQLCLAHGLTAGQLELLEHCVQQVEKRTAFRIMPRSPDKPSRSVRSFRDCGELEGILDLLDAGGSPDDAARARAASSTYLTWANKSKRDDIAWPRHDIDRMVALLAKLGVATQNVVRYPVPEEKGFERLEVLRSIEPKKSRNLPLAWLLVVVYVTAAFSDSQADWPAVASRTQTT